MKITAVDVFPVQQFVYIKISTDNDLYGIGEASLSGRTMSVVHAFDHLRPLLIGQDATRIEHIWQDVFRRARRCPERRPARWARCASDPGRSWRWETL